MNWCVYLLECSDGTFYCGITNDISRRINEHNGIVSGGARYTKGKRPVRIIASIPVRNRAEALKLEFQVKRIHRRKKLELFNCASPEESQILIAKKNDREVI